MEYRFEGVSQAGGRTAIFMSAAKPARVLGHAARQGSLFPWTYLLTHLP